MKNIKYPLYEVEVSENLKDFIESKASEHGTKSVFQFTEKRQIKSKSYKDLCIEVTQVGTFLLDKGYTNDHMAVLGENSYEWILAYFSVINSSNVIVPIDKDLGYEEITWLIKQSDCKVLFYDQKYQKEIDDIKSNNLDILFICVNKKKETNNLDIECMIRVGKQLINEGNKIFSQIEIDANQLAAIHYTSGTTGVSKGVMLSHNNILSSAIGAAKNANIVGNSILVLPLHHTYGFTVGVVCSMAYGNTIYINNSLKRLSKDFIEQKPDHMFFVPLFVETLHKKIWSTAEKNGKAKILRGLIAVSNALMMVKIDIRRILLKSVLASFGGNLRQIICGGAPLDPKYVKGFRDIGIDIYNGYGITECSPIVAVNRNNHYRDGSVGQVLNCCDVKIDNPDDRKEGEILVRGQNVMLGYYKNKTATDESTIDGWFKTGDYGKLDDDGFLYITGRKKNIIISNTGKNVYPEEIELHLYKNEYIKEAIVYSHTTKEESEHIVAEIYPDYEALMDQNKSADFEINRHIDKVNNILPYYKNIKSTKIREVEFEKTSTKKIIRK